MKINAEFNKLIKQVTVFVFSKKWCRTHHHCQKCRLCLGTFIGLLVLL